MSRAVRRVPVLALTAGLSAAALVAGLAGCSHEPPGPQAEAKALAAALSSGSFTAVHLTDGTAAADERTAAFEALGNRTPEVKVASVVVDPDDDTAATVKLDWSWDMAAPDDWTYTVVGAMHREKDEWSTAWNPALLAPDLTADEKVVVHRVQGARADVLGANDVPLVTERAVQRIGIDKTHVAAADQPKAAKALATALDIDSAAYVKRVAGAGSKAFVEAIVVRDGDKAYDVAKLTAIDGVSAVADKIPLAPTRTFARPVLGTVGAATAEIVEKSDGQVAAGDTTGLSGLQRQYDAQLRGTPGMTVDAVDGDGAERQLFEVAATDGTPLRTTIDETLQTIAEDTLAKVGPASALVAIRPSTGDVLAVASGPGGNGMSTATLGQFAPGSTFKVVSTLALLRTGLSADSGVTCPTSITVDGREFRNFPDYPSAHTGDIDLRTAFANSCNTAFIGQRDTVSQDDVIAAAGSLGLTGSGPLGFAAFLGAVPSDSKGTDHAATMIGQARVLASPLGMATVAASVAHGATVVPRLVVPSSDATPTPTASLSATPAPTESARPVVALTADEAKELHGLMRGVVTSGGATFLQDVPGGEVAAKTGTAQFGTGDDLKNHVWMIAIQGDLAVAVFVDEGVYGSTTAGPLLERFLTNIPR
ncbi:penicillin-binding transpeptidase domain-containing protein [Cellulomonas sp. HZM]|uniref:penicillin-binding transpeptidase domain-containing protein n=1 Tax=Cellulomonas sp. HZM TaxID=1454010 RepID=UPI0004939477|nr:penicillin-binding transpeptidase domain-containing protein [Cellulomonas sp. HZM]